MSSRDLAESRRVRGMRDLGPAEMAAFRRIAEAFRTVCDRWAFDEIRTPVIEHLHLFTSAGTLSPQLLDRVYSFLDWDGWSGERVVLRPDSTIAAARYLQESAIAEPARLFYVQNVFRFSTGDEPRELWQCGAELLGNTEPLGDIQLIVMALEVLDVLDLTDVRVSVSHAGIVRSILAATGLSSPVQMAIYDRLLDGDGAAIGEIEARLPELNAPLHLLFESTGGSAFVGNMRALFEGALPSLVPSLLMLETVTSTLERLEIPVQVVTALARNFEYYTGTVFRLHAGGNALGGGGRYDNLVVDGSGRRLPASGFVLETDTLLPLVAPGPERSDSPLLVRALDARPATIAVALAAVEAAHRRGAGARLAADGEPGKTLEVGGDPPVFHWEEQTIGAGEDAVAVALGLPR